MKKVKTHQKQIVVFITLALTVISTNAYALLTSKTGFIYPADSYWSGKYVGWLQVNGGNGQYHLAIDFDKNVGDPIYAIADGEVVDTRTQYVGGQNEGGALVIKHQLSNGDDFTALYGHITIGKSKGDQVKAGEQIGTIADCMTQWGNLPHLHFEIHPNPAVLYTPAYTSSLSDLKGCVDPLAFLENQTPAAAALHFSARIDDKFIGQGYSYTETHRPDEISQAPYAYADVISYRNWDKFDIQWMDVNVDENRMGVNIRTDYTPGKVPGSTNLWTDYGDLFISTNGWTPDSEVWEYVFDTSTGNLYDIRNAGDHILSSNDVYGPQGSLTYRHDQEVTIDPASLVSVGKGTAVKQGDYYSLDFDASALNLLAGMTLGFHWTMSCANDVIEGMTTLGTPEPSTLLLLGSGLVGVFAIGRKRLQK